MTDLKEFNGVEAGAAELRHTFNNLPEVISTKNDLEAYKLFHKDVRSIRIDVESRRKELKKPYLDAGKEIDKAAKAAISLVDDMEKSSKRMIDEFKESQVDRSQETLDKWGGFVSSALSCDDVNQMQGWITLIESDLNTVRFNSHADAAKVARGSIDAITRRILEVNALGDESPIDVWAKKWGVSDDALRELKEII